MTKVNRDADGNTIFRKDIYGQKIACIHCVLGHRTSNCKPWHNDQVRVIDGVGRKRGGKNLPKNSCGVTKRGGKARPRRASSGNSQMLQSQTQQGPILQCPTLQNPPLQNPPLQSQPLQNTVMAQPATNRQPVANFQVPVQTWQAGVNLHSDMARAIHQAIAQKRYYNTVTCPVGSFQFAS